MQLSHDTLQIALTIYDLNDLEVEVSDIENTYVTAPVKGKVWSVSGP